MNRMIDKERNSSFRFVIVFALLILFQVAASAADYPDAITNFSGGASYCEDAAATGDLDITDNLTITCSINFSSCRGRKIQPFMKFLHFVKRIGPVSKIR